MISTVRAFFTTQCVTARNFSVRSAKLKTGWKAVKKRLWIGVAAFAMVVGGWSLEKGPEQGSAAAHGVVSEGSVMISRKSALLQGSWQAGGVPVFEGNLPEASLAQPSSSDGGRAGFASETRCPQPQGEKIGSNASLQRKHQETRSALLLLILAHLASSSQSGSP